MPYTLPRCRIIPLPDDQVSFAVDGVERLRWHFGRHYERPFFYPFVGPSGGSLTRMGHPGAANHDHHRSIWFAHHKVLGIDFWTNGIASRVRQQQWLAYEDGDEEAAMAVRLGWYDGHEPAELLRQDLVAAVRPGTDGETFLELQSTFHPTSESLEFGQTNFGFLAVRVAKSISAHFGGGHLTSSEGGVDEKELFGKQARWMDYSGPVASEHAQDASPANSTNSTAIEGVTYFDHPANPGYPVHWHVREDGWMGASACMHSSLSTTREKPLTVRYLLHAHGSPVQADRANVVADDFAARAAFALEKAPAKHTEHTIRRHPGA